MSQVILDDREMGEEEAAIERMVSDFSTRRHLFETLAQSLTGHLQGEPDLRQYIHFIKWRVKEIGSLRTKLRRKAAEEKERLGVERLSDVDMEGVFGRVTDLAGVRILHLHTEQMKAMHELILKVLDEHRYELQSAPTANCWDVEYERLYRKFGIATASSAAMYTTVHYDVIANQRTKLTCELQVRSLMDEVWSEVSHRVNYPEESPSVSCRDQLKVLARLTTGGTRLVDSIFRSHREEGE